MMSTMFVIQMYSSGMPILYFNGLIFYLVTYCVNKFLLIYYYQKSRTLTRNNLVSRCESLPAAFVRPARCTVLTSGGKHY